MTNTAAPFLPKPSKAVSARYALAMKVVFSGVAIWLMWNVFVLVKLMTHRPPPASYAGDALQREMAEAGNASASREDIRFPWPRYPGARETGRSGVMLNGVPILDQTLKARARPEQILTFYRRSMRGRGWRDNTEEFYKVNRRVLGEAGSFRNLQDENFLRRYDAVMRSKLSLVRGENSILMEVRPGEKGRHIIELHFAGTPSLMGMIEEMAEKAKGRGARPVPYLDVEGMPGNASARSRVYRSEQPHPVYFEQMLHELQREGWSQTTMPKGLRPPQGTVRRAMFARGDEVAVLVVKPFGEDGAVAMITQSSPLP